MHSVVATYKANTHVVQCILVILAKTETYKLILTIYTGIKNDFK